MHLICVRYSRVNIAFRFILVTLIFTIAGCQTTGGSISTSDGDGQNGQSYGLFFSPSDHVTDLLKSGDVAGASRVWNEQSDYFRTSDRASVKAATNSLSERLRTDLEARAAAAAVEIAAGDATLDRAGWPGHKQRIANAERLAADSASHRVLAHSGGEPGKITALRALLAEHRIQWTARACDAMRPFVEVPSESFFDAYPIGLEGPDVMRACKSVWMPLLSDKPADRIAAFGRIYKDHLDDVDLRAIAALHLDVVRRDFPAGRGRLAVLMDAIAKTREAGLPVDTVPDARVRIVQITSRSLLQDGEIEFPVGIDVDVPFSVDKSDLAQALEGPEAGAADILVLLDVAMARNDRNIRSYDRVNSEFQSGTRVEPNGQHALAQAQVTQAQLTLAGERQRANINAATCYGVGCLLVGIANGIVVATAESKVKSAMDTLAGTPMTIEKPVYAPYEFNKASIDAAKLATINYYVIDRSEKTLVQGTFDVREEKSFVVAYGLKDNDRNRHQFIGSTDTEDKVVDFERTAVTVPLSKILARYFEAGGTKRTLPTATALHSEITATKNRAIASAQSRQYRTTLRDDARFHSVVVVQHPGGGFGSGFYVRDDLVLTNYHVIRDARFIEMKRFDKTETFGKVVAEDIRLDLALIKVQARGTPVRFYEGTSLPVGQTVEAIGHPKGLQFSIARGVVSGMREITSAYAAGGRKVRFIQTDAAINPGNSGGPLFLEDKVVGVNTQKLAAGLEGLSFAVHYGEILEFIKAHAGAGGLVN